LTEAILVAKMAEFLSTLDQVKRYHKLASTMADFVLVIAASIVALLAIQIAGALLNPYDFLSTWTSFSVVFSSVLVIGVGVLVGVVWVNRKVNSVPTQKWRSSLNEGASGVLKLLQEINWETVFNDIRFAKLGFTLYGVVTVVAYWLLTSFIGVILAGFIGVNIFHFSFKPALVLGVSLIFAVVLCQKDISKRYEHVGRLDSLLWELRWFEEGFRRTDFQT
jgi:MFS family permease